MRRLSRDTDSTGNQGSDRNVRHDTQAPGRRSPREFFPDAALRAIAL